MGWSRMSWNRCRHFALWVIIVEFQGAKASNTLLLCCCINNIYQDGLSLGGFHETGPSGFEKEVIEISPRDIDYYVQAG